MTFFYVIRRFEIQYIYHQVYISMYNLIIKNLLKYFDRIVHKNLINYSYFDFYFQSTTK